MEALSLQRSLGGTSELLFSISTWSELVLHPDVQLAGQNMGKGQQEPGQRLGNLLDEARPGEQGLPSSGRRRRRLGESPGPPGEDSQAVLPPAKLWDVSVPWVTLESSFQTHFPACS